MAVARPEKLQRRSPLTRERVLKAAVRLADREGIDAVSMRRLGTELGIEAMSLYTHVQDKDDLLNGMVELVIREIPIHHDGADWKTALRATVLGARSVRRSVTRGHLASSRHGPIPDRADCATTTQ